MTDLEFRKLIEDGDVSVTYDGFTDGLRVFTSGNDTNDDEVSFLGVEVEKTDALFTRVGELLESGALVIDEDGEDGEVLLYVNDQVVETRFLYFS